RMAVQVPDSLHDLETTVVLSGGRAAQGRDARVPAQVVIGEWDFHTVKNYLACPEIRHLVSR
ncbi:MAG: hypothetical protein ACRDTG_32895, partial [Pseudonocardiaceae bacterium]